jgi:hypothetical protein
MSTKLFPPNQMAPKKVTSKRAIESPQKTVTETKTPTKNTYDSSSLSLNSAPRLKPSVSKTVLKH